MKLLVLMLIATMTVMSGAAIAPGLDQIQKHFQLVENSEIWVKLVLTIPALFTALTGFISGRLIQKFGLKFLLVSSIALYGIAGTAGLYLVTLPELLISRAFLGSAVGIMMTCSTTLIVDYYTGSARDRAMGLQNAAMALGGVLFVIVGGLLADSGWRLSFSIYSFAFIVLPLAFLYLPKPSASLNTQTLEVNTIGLIIRKYSHLIHVYTLAFLIMIIFYTIPVHLSFFLKSLAKTSSAEVGMAMATMAFSTAVFAVIFEKIKAKVSEERLAIISFSSMALGFLFISKASNYGQVVASMPLIGFGMGFLIPNFNLWVVRGVKVEDRASVYGVLTTCFFLGQFMSPLFTFVMNTSFGLRSVYWGATIFLIIMILGALKIKK